MPSNPASARRIPLRRGVLLMLDGGLRTGEVLRLPEEGPCECDLYLTCTKFLTTTEYAPRLKDRLCLEHTLAEDATDCGCPEKLSGTTQLPPASKLF
ncbi:hypothetical protein ACQP2U_13790 [Nocardia sp. CA-084685]|uniref:hypothetical protein n=1 Tax=Nocardia sp. CA-084685 TaxID=3239970 RepID=UPI003D99A67F